MQISELAPNQDPSESPGNVGSTAGGVIGTPTQVSPGVSIIAPTVSTDGRPPVQSQEVQPVVQAPPPAAPAYAPHDATDAMAPTYQQMALVLEYQQDTNNALNEAYTVGQVQVHIMIGICCFIVIIGIVLMALHRPK